jgi:hypothetical protein
VAFGDEGENDAVARGGIAWVLIDAHSDLSGSLVKFIGYKRKTVVSLPFPRSSAEKISERPVWSRILSVRTHAQ